MVKKVLVVVLAVIAVVLLADVVYIGSLLFAQQPQQPTVPYDPDSAISLYNPYNNTQSTKPAENDTLGSPYNPQSIIPTLPAVTNPTATQPTDANGEQPTQDVNATEAPTTQADPSSYSLEQVITAMNNAISYVKSAKNFTALKEQTGNAEILELSINWLRTPGQAIIQGIIDSIKPLTYNFVNGTATDPKTKEVVTPFDVIPPSGVAFKIDPAGVTAYGAKQNADGSITYTVRIREETCDLEEHPPYHSTCMGYLKLEQFDLGGAKIDSGTVTYHEGQIDITVDAQGLPVKFREYLPMTGVGSGSLGISATAKLTGYLEETWTFTW
ncbi:MAG: hypothetical protein E7523_12070 [Ruminococcaceae bacterium]|nr:hypothetical protein [Oscillospiraceae bacterium]